MISKLLDFLKKEKSNSDKNSNIFLLDVTLCLIVMVGSVLALYAVWTIPLAGTIIASMEILPLLSRSCTGFYRSLKKFY